eukprot:CAMPEP_0206130740 /NCGR_PEP_ID=MMETSP1472-20131121/42289_1 /ASSEMBLY_ACC=CAM_ASM_001108 /TAXON_ID=41880 /ORGANISM="Pycnococcus provasolii, Strain RCC251" /LENGTH=51 /DNA_ID=CAMNT_0053522123 /DNA_START=224 /DNA_END=379 /DNA_ORIENTATION=+
MLCVVVQGCQYAVADVLHHDVVRQRIIMSKFQPLLRVHTRKPANEVKAVQS